MRLACFGTDLLGREGGDMAASNAIFFGRCCLRARDLHSVGVYFFSGNIGMRSAKEGNFRGWRL